MCGSLYSVCVSSWMHGRLELMQPVFQMILFRVGGYVYVCPLVECGRSYHSLCWDGTPLRAGCI